MVFLGLFVKRLQTSLRDLLIKPSFVCLLKICKKTHVKQSLICSISSWMTRIIYLFDRSPCFMRSPGHCCAGGSIDITVVRSKVQKDNYRLITAYLLLRVNYDKIMHARWDFDVSSARTRRVSELDKHQKWSASVLFCHNSGAQSKYAVVNLIHTWRNQTFLFFYY